MKNLVVSSVVLCLGAFLLGGVSITGAPAELFDDLDLDAGNTTTAIPIHNGTSISTENPSESTTDVTSSSSPEISTSPESPETSPEVTTSPGGSSPTPHSSSPATIFTPSGHSSMSTPGHSTTPTPAKKGFDVGSFFGGIATGLGVIIIAFVAYKCYSARKGKGYNTM